MLTIRAFALVLFLSLTFGFAARPDAGCGIDPNGCNGGLAIDGGGAMDPNGLNGDYTGCIDPNGSCRER